MMYKANSCNTLPNYYLHEENRPEYANSVITFVHIAKTGGDSMRKCLSNLASMRGRPVPFSVGFNNYCSVVLNHKTNGSYVIDSDIIMGHRAFGMCDLLRESRFNQKRCSYFTILRDPFERMVSHYFYLRQAAASSALISPSAIMSLKMSIKEWTLYQGSEMQNKLFWTGEIGKHPNGSHVCQGVSQLPITRFRDEKLMEDILSNIDRHFGVIGLTSEYLKTLRMLQRAYQLPFYDVCKEFAINKGDYNSTEDAARKKVKEEAIMTLKNDAEIRQLLHLDIKLYEKAKQIFNEQNRIMEDMNKD